MKFFIFLLAGITLTATAFAQRLATTEAYRHRVVFTPLSGIVAYSYVNPASGFDYEYLLSPSKGIGVHIPMSIGFDDGAYTDFRHTSFFVAPGLLFHSGPGKHVDFAIGPSLLFGNMRFQPRTDNPNAAPFNPYSLSMVALLVDNSVNFNYKQFQWGLDFRMGPMLEKHNNTQLFWNFGAHFGGRF